MRKLRWLTGSGVAVVAILASTSQVALALPANPPKCPPDYELVGSRCLPNEPDDPSPPPPAPPPPAPKVAPTLSIEGAQQTTDFAGIHVWGWTAEEDAPVTTLTVAISVDGGPATTITANKDRPDVANGNPSYGAAHG